MFGKNDCKTVLDQGKKVKRSMTILMIAIERRGEQADEDYILIVFISSRYYHWGWLFLIYLILASCNLTAANNQTAHPKCW